MKNPPSPQGARGPHHSASQLFQKKTCGFTLIEMLVVLILVGLISGILFEALARASQLQERFGVELFRVQQGQMALDWYRQSVQGLHPDYPEGQHVFAGKAQEFAGLSNNPLGEDYGALTPVLWKIRANPAGNSAELVYVAGQQETPIFSWRGRNSRFVYLDAQLNAHPAWPPPLGKFPQLPQQIHLLADEGEDSIHIVAVPRGPGTPPLRPQDLLGIIP